jgi:hypothetical protein
MKRMSAHKLGPGRAVISALSQLGTSLGYVPVTEWAIPPTSAAIDLAWLREAADSAPLMAFEVESRAGEGLANNAMKLLGKTSGQIPKPLHFFHLVVKGGTRSSRPIDVASEFADHNYSVHLLSRDGEPEKLLESVLAVHRRVADHIDGVALAQALARPPWPRASLESILLYAEGRGFSGLNELAYMQLARESDVFLPSLLRKLKRLWWPQLSGEAIPLDRNLEPPDPREGHYSSYMGAHLPEPLELGLIAALAPELGDRAFAVLREWQQLNRLGELGPFTGSGQQWTEYIVGNLGFVWALVAALMHEVPGARAWCAQQAFELLDSIYRGTAPDIPLLAVWVMHMCAGASGCGGMYEHARKRLEVDGGVNPDWIRDPEPAAPAHDADWTSILGCEAGGIAPAPSDLQSLVRGGPSPGGNPVILALDALLEDPGMRPSDGAALARLLCDCVS